LKQKLTEVSHNTSENPIGIKRTKNNI